MVELSSQSDLPIQRYERHGESGFRCTRTVLIPYAQAELENIKLLDVDSCEITIHRKIIAQTTAK